VIHVYGTSHVSEQSLDLIDEKIEEHDPDTVAIELDPVRLQSLLSEGETGTEGPLLIKLLQKFQAYIGGKTGLMPGQEMLYAYNKAQNQGKDTALIDQDIRITVDRLKTVKRKEKVKAGISLILGTMLPFGEKMRVNEIPGQEDISSLVSGFKDSFPGIYHVLMEQRNIHMEQVISRLQRENPEKDIAVFLGAAHRKSVSKLLRGEGFEVNCKDLLGEK